MRILPSLLCAFALHAGPGFAVPLVFTDAGPAAADIQDSVDAFRAQFSGLNPFTPTNGDRAGRREINWDGVPDGFADPNAFPGDFFNGGAPGRARGAVFAPTGLTTGFEVSASTASGAPILFGEPDEYAFFSPERIFRPIGGQTFDVLFFDPFDQTTPALTRGFGAVFTGLEEIGQVVLTFYGADGGLLAEAYAPPSGPANLSFLGVAFDDPLIARVTFGTLLPNYGEAPVMDDFIYGEPVAVAPVPLPAALVFSLSGLAGLVACRRRRGARAGA